MLKYSWSGSQDDGKSQCVITWNDRRSGSTVSFEVRTDRRPNEPAEKMDSRLRGQALKLAKAFLADQEPKET